VDAKAQPFRTVICVLVNLNAYTTPPKGDQEQVNVRFGSIALQNVLKLLLGTQRYYCACFLQPVQCFWGGMLLSWDSAIDVGRFCT
jgi:hypothetical protein